ncbi:MAG TPA: integrase, partial [Burkholderiales bacterium]
MQLDRVDARSRLKVRRDAYWQRLAQGRYVGFRRLAASTPGTWLARIYRDEGYEYKPLGDFAQLEPGERFDAAKVAAEEWFRHLDHGGSTARATVKVACEAYVENRRIEKSDAAAADVRGRYERLVYDDPIARVELTKLAPRHLADWKGRVIAKGGTRGSYNRNATALRAALNLSYRRRDVASDHAWREELKPLDNAARRRTLYLDGAKRRRLVDVSTDEARPLFRTLNMLPMRPGDVAKLRVEYLQRQQRALEIPTGKAEAR